jgi:nucleolar pre-ribosomal-associated protein 2
MSVRLIAPAEEKKSIINESSLVLQSLVMMVDGLDSAEATTRFLRSSKDLRDSIVSTASILLERGHLYPSNLKVFILDLLCDRLNDGSSAAFKDWKYDPQVWHLFSKTWLSLSHDDNDRRLRGNHVKKLKLVAILIQVMRYGPTASRHALLQGAIDAANFVLADAYIQVDEGSAVELLASYADCIASMPVEEFRNDWTFVVTQIYHLAFLRINARLSKKTHSKFYAECLPALLKVMALDDDRIIPTIRNISVIVTRVISQKEAQASLAQNVKLMLTESALEPAVLTHFFDLVVKTGAKNMEVCEQVFSAITQIPRYHALSEPLLAILVSANRTISASFLAQLYTEEFVTAKNIDWALVRQLIVLDVDIAVEHGPALMDKVPPVSELSIGDALVSAYSKARELPAFIDTVWPNAIVASHHKKWNSNLFIDIVAKSIAELSTIQLTTVISALIDAYDKPAGTVVSRITAVVKGLYTCTDARIEAAEVVFTSSDKFGDIVQQSWAMSYHLLCLYPTRTFVRQENLVVRKPTAYYFYTVFRMHELSDHTKLVQSLVPKYILFLESEPVASLEVFLERWPVLANSTFSREQLTQVAMMILQRLELGVLMRYFDDFGWVFFEQDTMCDTMVSVIYDYFTCVRPKTDLSLILLKFPIQCIPKALRVKLIDLLVDEKDVAALKCVKHLLSHPSRSQIETKYDALLSLVSSSSSENEDVVLSICKKVMNHHAHSISDAQSRAFIDEAFAKLIKKLSSMKPKKCKRLPIDFKMAIISIRSVSKLDAYQEQVKQLKNAFRSASIAYLAHLSKTQSFEELESLLDSLIELQISDPSVHDAIKRIGSQVVSVDSVWANKLKTSLFLAKAGFLSKTGSNAVYLSSLYLALNQECNLDYSVLTEFLSLLDEADLPSVFEIVIASLDHANTKDTSSLIRILLAFLLSSVLRKEYDRKTCTTLLTGALSALADNLDLMSDELLYAVCLELCSCLTHIVWCFTQYSIELVLAFATRAASTRAVNLNTYKALTAVVSGVILHHRFRLTSRNHLVILVCVSLLEPLSSQGRDAFSTLATSSEAASYYSRLLGNICEPSNLTTGLHLGNSSLNSSSATYKRSLRRHLPVLLVNFINFALKKHFHHDVMEVLSEGVFKIFDVMSAIELQLVSSTLDIPSRAYYKTLYASYKDNGKWNDI